MANLQPSARGPRLASMLERSKRAGWFATGDEKVLEESKEKAARLVCNMIAVNIRSK
jgi:hypothetical protein